MRILIVGGGIAGLSLAVALEQRGIHADLVERAAHDTHAGTGLYLPGNATRAIGHLGLLDALINVATPIEHQRILNSRGRLLCDTRTRDVWARCAPCLATAHATVHGLLRNAIRRTAIRLGVSIAGIQQAADKCHVTFTDGTAGMFDVVVGADGIHSSVRQQVAPHVAPLHNDQVCWRFITRNTTAVRGWTAMLGDGSTLLAIPVTKDQAYVYADMTLSPESSYESARYENLAERFGHFAEPVFSLLEQAPDSPHRHYGRIGRIVTNKWVYGRVVLIGDAAHACSPNMAEGAGMAIEDALVLAQSLATTVSIDNALSAYTTRRLPRVQWVQHQCAARDKMRALPGWARAGLLRLSGNRLYKRSYGPLLAQI